MSRKKRHLKTTPFDTLRRAATQSADHAPIKPKKSLGALRKAHKTKPRSPDATGKLALQRRTLEAIVNEFDETRDDEVICNIAAWKNQDQQGPYLTVEVSPPFLPHEHRVPKPSIFDDIFNNEDE
jgi:hypothetical protein